MFQIKNPVYGGCNLKKEVQIQLYREIVQTPAKKSGLKGVFGYHDRVLYDQLSFPIASKRYKPCQSVAFFQLLHQKSSKRVRQFPLCHASPTTSTSKVDVALRPNDLRNLKPQNAAVLHVMVSGMAILAGGGAIVIPCVARLPRTVKTLFARLNDMNI